MRNMLLERIYLFERCMIFWTISDAWELELGALCICKQGILGLADGLLR
jgi:hypothetical protein